MHANRTISFKQSSGTDAHVISRERHREHLAKCVAHLENYLHIVQKVADKDSKERPGDEYAIEIASEELRLALVCLGRLTGRVNVEEVLDVVFADFCIGK